MKDDGLLSFVHFDEALRTLDLSAVYCTLSIYVRGTRSLYLMRVGCGDAITVLKCIVTETIYNFNEYRESPCVGIIRR